MKSIWNGKSKRSTLLYLVVVMLTLGTGCDDSPMRPGEGFYSYQGYRDWWRIPLKFPYQILIIDLFDQGYLEKYDPDSLIADPRCQTLAGGITEAGYDERFAVFKQMDQAQLYVFLSYKSGEIRKFASMEELTGFIRQNYPDTPVPEMNNLETFYDRRWKALDAIREKEPHSLDYGY